MVAKKIHKMLIIKIICWVWVVFLIPILLSLIFTRDFLTLIDVILV